MVVELLVTLVEAIGRCEERDRIGNVNGNRNIQLATGIKHGIESGIINLNQRAGGNVLPQIETECLQNLEPTRSVSVCFGDRLRLNLGIIGLLEFGVARFRECVEPAGMGFVVLGYSFGQALIITSG